MKGSAILLFLLLAVGGCFSAPTRTEPPTIQSLHPVGFPRLIKIAPECDFAKPDIYDSCVVASRMLETSTTQISTHLFLGLWESTVFGNPAQPAPVGPIERIVVPALKNLYQASQDTYSRTMLLEADRIQLTSKASLDAFKKIHQCLVDKKKPSECKGR